MLQVPIEQCATGASESAETKPQFLPTLPGKVVGKLGRIDDDQASISVDLTMPSLKSGDVDVVEPSTRTVPIAVTFYDMPSLENIRLPDGGRVAFTLSRFRSRAVCERFSLGKTDGDNYDDNYNCKDLTLDPAGAGKRCIRAEMTMALVGKEYIFPKDRPFLNTLTSLGSNSFLQFLKAPFSTK